MKNDNCFVFQYINNFILVLFILLTASGCRTPDPYVYVCRDGEIDYREMSGIEVLKSQIDTAQIFHLNITSQSQYVKYVGNSTGTAIDFEKETLLLGCYHSRTVVQLVRKTVMSDCPGKKINFAVTLVKPTEGITDAAGHQNFYFVIVPKFSDDTKVNFEVIY